MHAAEKAREIMQRSPRGTLSPRHLFRRLSWMLFSHFIGRPSIGEINPPENAHSLLRIELRLQCRRCGETPEQDKAQLNVDTGGEATQTARMHCTPARNQGGGAEGGG